MSDRRDADRLACAFRVLGCAMHYRPLAPSDTIVSGAAVTLIDMASTGTADDRARAILDGLAARRLQVERILREIPALHGGALSLARYCLMAAEAGFIPDVAVAANEVATHAESAARLARSLFDPRSADRIAALVDGLLAGDGAVDLSALRQGALQGVPAAGG